MTKREPITYADSVPDLPESGFAKRMKEMRIARLFAERSAANQNAQGKTQQRGPSHTPEKSMVEKDRPHPAPRPSPGLAAEVDAASFDARWEAERQRHTQSYSPQPQTGETAMSDDTESTRRPEETLREGSLKAAIWRNEGEHGAYHSVIVARTYKDREGNLQDTQSFRAKDMLGLSELARQTHHTVQDRDRELFKERRQSQQAQAQSRGRGHSR
ncbi:hypothetical protein [Roseobacter sp. MH60115]|uniref:hypothetical protein n=1 Tax=Roseobacter sp. MH60115 TaxID=2785324 RepID=UPI0018A2CDD3|nr:hypothetical protein [Roseobacter sp. MH60115]